MNTFRSSHDVWFFRNVHELQSELAVDDGLTRSFHPFINHRRTEHLVLGGQCVEYIAHLLFGRQDTHGKTVEQYVGGSLWIHHILQQHTFLHG